MSFDLSRVREFFSKDPQNRELSPSVVNHDRLDDTYLRDIRARSEVFQGVIDNPPNVPVGSPPDQCGSCGHTGDPWYSLNVASNKLKCDKCQAEVAMPVAPYNLWADLVSDMWRAHYTYDEPSIKDTKEIKEGHGLNRRLMTSVINNETFLDTRASTRMDDSESAYASMGTALKIQDSIADGALSDFAKRAQDLAEKESDVEQMERELESFREDWEKGQQESDEPGERGQGGPEGLTDDQLQRLVELADTHDQASQEMEAVQAEIASTPMTQAGLDDIHEAIAHGNEQAENYRDLTAMCGPGTESASLARMNPDRLFALAEQMKDNEILREAARFIGRIQRNMEYHRSNRVKGGFEEIVDIEQGNDVSRLLPMELGKLDDPDLELQFDYGYVERTLQQFEMVGDEPEGKGPMVMLIDESTSMKQMKMKWAKAICLAVVNIAHKERRDAAVVAYSYAADQEVWFFPAKKPLDPEAVVDCVTHNFAGGTDITEAVTVGRQIMEKVPEFEKADLCIITDGEDDYQDDDEQEKELLHAAGVRIHGIAIGQGLGYLNQMCDHVTHIAQLSTPGSGEDASKALAVSIT